MNRRNVWVVACAAGLASVMTFAVAQEAEKPKTDQPGHEEMQAPPGWTAEDMQACILAGMPGAQHEFLARRAGTWVGKTQMWMMPGSEAMVSECTYKITPVMDGRFIECEMAGEMPGMGPYKGYGLAGFDNVTQKFVGNWIDNHGTGIMNGVGELSEDGKTVTWKYTYNCPITKKPTVMREIETMESDNSMSLEMYMKDPKSGEEYKGMRIDFTRKS